MRIAQLANFWTPTSGGLRVVLEHLAVGYHGRGHRVLQVVPGATDDHQRTPWGRRTTIAAPSIPGSGGYRMALRSRHLELLLDAWRPDVVEVSDRATMVGPAARWAARQSRPVRVVLVAHEQLDQILAAGPLGVAGRRCLHRVADRWNPRCHRDVDAVVVPSHAAGHEWRRLGIAPDVVPWGVDTDAFVPLDRAERGSDAALALVWVGRLSREKRPDLAVDAVAALVGLGVPVTLDVLGDGPQANRLASASDGLPVTWHGHVGDVAEVAATVARSTVALSTSGIETFGLTVLEALACGVPVVACGGGAAAAVAGPAGCAVAPNGAAIAAGALALWRQPQLRTVARERALRSTWDDAVDSMLAIHRGARVLV